jgi:hypothetical protein
VRERGEGSFKGGGTGLQMEMEEPPGDHLGTMTSSIALSVSYFFMGAAMLAPWNAFITATDYFSLAYVSERESFDCGAGVST